MHLTWTWTFEQFDWIGSKSEIQNTQIGSSVKFLSYPRLDLAQLLTEFRVPVLSFSLLWAAFDVRSGVAGNTMHCFVYCAHRRHESIRVTAAFGYYDFNGNKGINRFNPLTAVDFERVKSSSHISVPQQRHLSVGQECLHSRKHNWWILQRALFSHETNELSNSDFWLAGLLCC